MQIKLNKKHRRYSRHKNTGIPWLGEVPENWEVRKLKTLCKVKRGASPRPIDDPKYFDEDGEYAWVRISDVTASNTYLTETTQRLSFVGKNLSVPLKPNDLFLSIAGSVGKPMITKIKCCIHDGFVFFENLKYSKKLLYYIFYAGEAYKGLGKLGTQLNLNTETVGSIYLPNPSKEEQTAIANYLDEKTALLDQTIEAKRKQIELLKEKRTSLINQAVTSGIDENAEMKESGVEWIGEIPKSWEVSKLGFCLKKVNSGVTPKGGSESYSDEGIPLIRSLNVYSDGFRWENLAYIDEETYQNMSNSKVLKGDVLLNITGASIGRCFYYSGEFTKANVNQHVCILRPNKNLFFKFLQYFLISRAGQEQVYLIQMGTSREGLNYQQIKNFDICLPNFEEQQKIVTFLDSETQKIDQTIALIEKSISLLEEYKTSLISNVVTGKVKIL